MDWNNLEQHQETYRFAQGMIAFRLEHPVLSHEQFYTDPEIRWFDTPGGLPQWTAPDAKCFACLIQEDGPRALYLMFNASAKAVDFHLPAPPPAAQWRVSVDTFAETPRDLFAAGGEPLLQYAQTYLLKPRSSAILLARKPEYTDERGAK
jgi:glycogen operon protein